MYGQEAIWNRLGIDMPRSSLFGWLMQVTQPCDPLVKLMQKQIIGYDYIQADETSLQVLEEVGRDSRTK